MEIILQIFSYLGLFGLIASFLISFFKRELNIYAKIRDSRLLGFWLVFVICFKKIALISSINLELLENVVILVSTILIVGVDLKYGEKYRVYRVKWLFLLPLLDLFHYQEVSRFFSAALIIYLYSILDRIDLEAFFGGILNGIRLLVYSNVLFTFLFHDKAFKQGIGDSFFQSVGIDGRFQGIFDHPNGLALALCVYFVISDKRNYLESSLVLLMLISTGSRTGLICFFAIWAYRKFNTISRKRLLYMLGVINVVLPLFAHQISNWIPQIIDRKAIWDFSINSVVNSPLIGNGSDFLRISVENGDLPVYASQAHSQLIDVLVSYGVIGAFILIWTYWKLISKAWLRLEYGSLVLILLLFGLIESPVSTISIFSIPSILFITSLRGGEIYETTHSRPKPLL